LSRLALESVLELSQTLMGDHLGDADRFALHQMNATLFNIKWLQSILRRVNRFRRWTLVDADDE